jgi:hypothetical protein
VHNTNPSWGPRKFCDLTSSSVEGFSNALCPVNYRTDRHCQLTKVLVFSVNSMHTCPIDSRRRLEISTPEAT